MDHTISEDAVRAAMRRMGEERFVFVGDHNADPVKGDSFNHAINQILRHPRVDSSFVPSSSGGGTDTADFASGRLRVDYVLPSKDGLDVTGGGVFWPLPSQPGAALLAASDHRLVWLDVVVTPFIDEAVRGLEVTLEGDNAILTWRPSPACSTTFSEAPISWRGRPPHPSP